jgi:hypothetical protein
VNDFPIQKPGTQLSAIAASDSQRAVAEVQAALFIAQQRPRNMVAVLDKVANAFTRPGLAEVAEYEYARGGTAIKGPSIRAAEAIAQLYGNVQYGFRVLSQTVGDDDVPISEVEAFCFDVENNVRQARQFRVRHWRDRSPPKKGYVLTDERDVYELIANMAQRRTRACILSVLPGDIIEIAMAQVAVTLETTADTSPAGRKKIVEAFAEFGVTVEQIEARIQRRLDAMQPAQVIQLKRIITSLRDGMSTADSWFAQGAEDGAEPKRKSEQPAAVNAPQFGTPPPQSRLVAAESIARQVGTAGGEVRITPPMQPEIAVDPFAPTPGEVIGERIAEISQLAARIVEREPGEDDDEPPSPPVSKGEAAWIKRKAAELKVDITSMLNSVGASDATQLTRVQFDSLKKFLVTK